MSELVFADLVRETSTGAGTGALALSGATPGHRRFAEAVPVGARFHYAIAGVAHEQQWEVGEGECDGTSLVRHSVLASSSANGLVDFLPGLKIVTLTVASAWFADRQDVPTHRHDLTEVEGLQSVLDGKQPAGSYAAAAHDHATLALQDGNAASPALHFAGDISTGLFRPEPGALAISVGGIERARLGATGRLGIGTPNAASPVHVRWLGFDPFANRSAALTLEGAFGGGLVLLDGGGHVGLWATEEGDTLNISVGGAGHIPAVQIVSTGLRPAFDNYSASGSASRRWTQVYAATGAINTSDARDKHWLGPLQAQEIAAGRALMRELGLYQWLDARTTKGPDEARLHFGLRAQRAFAILTEHGLDWRRYAWCCHDRWIDDDGAEQDRFGIRPDQLALFLVAVIAHDIAALIEPESNHAAG
ncbi:hypothetical protein C7451_103241 [Blastomonas natatoria]|uniref:Peptidase S74 domain-containing protein n=1 Tax=Blastomonas natatoria TaxID=34015 RepID=A0A2V3V8P1_9SPHN|nr:hypothetical protein [Blastomonas natatoria]PXW78133.1 hypothetical protein C7451_103241 [Blastomonas natatoria]